MVNEIIVQLQERGLFPLTLPFTQDSRQVRKGGLFFAFSSPLRDQYIQQAIDKGAYFIVSDQPDECFKERFLIVKDVYESFCALHSFQIKGVDCSCFLTAVAGTNGKTTIVHLIEQIACQLSCSVGTAGTLGLCLNGVSCDVGLTTPSIDDQYRFLEGMNRSLVSHFVFEFSSHAIHQKRVVNRPLSSAIFSSFSQDHLDYHTSLSDYFNIKKSVFTQLQPCSFALLNRDDEKSLQIYKEMNSGVRTVFYGFSNQSDVRIQKNVNTVSILLEDSSELEYDFLLDWSDFNISNFVAALLWVRDAFKVSISDLSHLQQLTLPPGRMECVRTSYYPVYIDYAHTPDSVYQALSFLHNRYGSLVVVFGCGGERDKEKRPLMARSVEKFAHQTIVTEDNSRSEPSEAIFNDIRGGFQSLHRVSFIKDRETAIQQAVLSYSRQFCVVILGKGHEKFQEIGQQKNPFCDRTIVEKAVLSFLK